LNVLSNGTVGIGTSTPISAAQFEVALGSLSVSDSYYDQSKISNYSNVSVSSGQIQLALAWTCGSYSFVNPADGLTYGTVVDVDGKCWLDRNLGATEVASSSTDYNAYGSLFQWGRLADGHQQITWTNSTTGAGVYSTTAVLSSTDNPGTNLFITNGSGTQDWRSPQNNSLWQGTGGTNNPCPAGFRLPIDAEWVTLVNDEHITNAATAYSSSLKLAAAGSRNGSNGSVANVGGGGGYWSGSINGTGAYYLAFNSGSVYSASNGNRAYGFSVRCIKN
jgi:uncharacterized protein (TIGR02145 family)